MRLHLTLLLCLIGRAVLASPAAPAARPAAPAEALVHLQVTTEVISLDGIPAAATAEVRDLEVDREEDLKRGLLYQRLVDWRREREAQRPRGTWRARASVTVAPPIEFRILRNLIRLCMAAGFGVPEFADHKGVSAVPTKGERPPRVLVGVTTRGYTQLAPASEGSASLDEPALAARLTALRVGRPRSQPILLIVDDDVTYAQLSRALDLVGDAGFAAPTLSWAAPAPTAPRVVAGRAERYGSLDKELIRRVIRAEIGTVKACYEAELSRTPDLSGRVTVRFIIGLLGSVLKAEVQSSTLGNEDVERCLTAAVLGMKFPKPSGDGIVVVSYPFVLRVSEAEE